MKIEITSTLSDDERARLETFIEGAQSDYEYGATAKRAGGDALFEVAMRESERVEREAMAPSPEHALVTEAHKLARGMGASVGRALHYRVRP